MCLLCHLALPAPPPPADIDLDLLRCHCGPSLRLPPSPATPRPLVVWFPLIRSPLSKKEVLTTGRRPGAVGGDTDNHHGSRCGRGRVQLREEEEGQTGSERTIVHTLHARWVGPTIFLDRVGLFLENILVKCCTIAMVPTKHGTGPSHPVPTIQTKQTQLE
jgi:hypothetical protein